MTAHTPFDKVPQMDKTDEIEAFIEYCWQNNIGGQSVLLGLMDRGLSLSEAMKVMERVRAPTVPQQGL